MLKLNNLNNKDLITAKLLNESDNIRMSSISSLKTADKTRRSSSMRRVLLQQTVVDVASSGSSCVEVKIIFISIN